VQAGLEEGKVGEQGTHARLTQWCERRRQGEPGTAADGDALPRAGNPPIAGRRQPNDKAAQREVD